MSVIDYTGERAAVQVRAVEALCDMYDRHGTHARTDWIRAVLATPELIESLANEDARRTANIPPSQARK